MLLPRLTSHLVPPFLSLALAPIPLPTLHILVFRPTLRIVRYADNGLQWDGSQRVVQDGRSGWHFNHLVKGWNEMGRVGRTGDKMDASLGRTDRSGQRGAANMRFLRRNS